MVFFIANFLLFTNPIIVGQNRKNPVNLPSIVGEGKAHFFYAYYISTGYSYEKFNKAPPDKGGILYVAAP